MWFGVFLRLLERNAFEDFFLRIVSACSEGIKRKVFSFGLTG